MYSLQSILLGITLICAVGGTADEQYKLVETTNGNVRGIQKHTLLENIPFYSFKGIPYAKPPIGDLRFKAPEPAESWEPNTLDAIEHSPICFSPKHFYPNNFTQSEDCLTLNIYVPADVNSDEKLAVMFFIHGGGFVEGYSNDNYYGPDFIVEKKTILVTINYRLGVLGFLSLNTPEISGNMGLKDQQLALKWISSNIGWFGGDCKRITVFGESAGGALAHFHVLSAESRKYFRNAIPMSGTTENHWAWYEHKSQLEISYRMANELGEPKEKLNELIEFLMSASAEDLSKYSTIDISDNVFAMPFAPVVERSDAKQPFITESPETIYKTTKIDMDVLFTMTSLEVSGFVSLFHSLEESNADFRLRLPFKDLKAPLDTEVCKPLVDEIRQFYFGRDQINDQQVGQYVQFLSYANFGYGIDKSVILHASKSSGKAFYLRLSVDSKLNVYKKLETMVANLTGASHEDDMIYVFRAHKYDSVYEDVIESKNDEDSKISLRTIDYITTIITNFAKYGEPAPKKKPVEFRPVQGNSIQFLDISNDGLTFGLKSDLEEFKLWKDIEQRAKQISDDLLKQKRDEL